MARRRPSSVLPVLSRTHGGPVKPKPRSGLPKGVSKTLSGKFQARIKLNGKRYDLGTFMDEDAAAAAYADAKAAGVAGRPSPVANRTSRGTGTAHPPHTRASRRCNC